MSEKIAKHLFIPSSILLIALVGFGYGLATERYSIWPYYSLHEAMRIAKSYAEFGEVIPEGRRIPAPPGAARSVFTVYDKDLIGDGLYVFTGWNDQARLYGSWLYDSRGRLMHTWIFDYKAMDPDGPLNGETYPHPVYPLHDGSLIVAFDSGDMMVRIDACSEPVWIRHGIYHHSISRGDDGTFWTWRADGTPYGQYQYIVNFDAETGETIREISLINDIIPANGQLSAIFGVRPDFSFRDFPRNPVFMALYDIFHPNDVEVLSQDLAPRFPMFSPGDLLLSFRSINLVTVIDPTTYRVKWWSNGPWIGQHDPDFTSDGLISVFNNNPTRERSEIVRIDPSTRTIDNELFNGDVRFYTETMGKHQYLPNGNVLIVVPDEGRVLEVTSDGRRVMEFDNLVPHTPQFNDHVSNGIYVPKDYFERIPSCPN